ncbi:type VII toxin-antitoxin system HepT family RNase toxin [Heliophilum fasciatum]|uniref:Uncharacterized protein YutE (UPF0331/DUF86 family) n=1 Tax=Heliophilum fasciatum TaxID=35700 RepID=A0A4R2RKR5_9FIRM|nr:DUF86 domain-containing protein [Heliophilum fasciatum]MCW2278569.1 uncharacterized protein YutE (UPF0331/DUF86 family) [Heliophilum fasciatum]TCP63524.1 uncharacterized protein YutE (UPF0331/DUF86 family) [Heliophilum fasciatum]
MTPDVAWNKRESIERCWRRIQEEYAHDPANLHNYTKQDAIVLNIQRMCETAIDLAAHTIAVYGWGIPQNSRDMFAILCQQGVIDSRLEKALKAMVGFRNIAVHEYQRMNLRILQNIIEKDLEDVRFFAQVIVKLLDNSIDNLIENK